MGEANRRKQAGHQPGGGGEVPPGMVMLAVDGPVPKEYAKHVPLDGGGSLVISRDEFLILCGLPGMRASEQRALRTGHMEIGIAPVGDALFLVTKIQGFATLDLPYDYTKGEPKEKRGLPERQPGQGFSIFVVGWDTQTGIVQGIRMVSVTPQFSGVLEGEIRRLAERAEAPDWHYSTDVLRAYGYWSKPDDMLADAKYRETAGMPFPAERQGQAAPKGAH